MAMVQPKSQKLRLFATHLGLLIFIAAIMFPLLMVIAISLREGNFATGSLIPENISWEHWKLALGFSVEHADGRVTPPPFPVLLWLWNSVKVASITAIGIVTLSTTCAYAFARMRFPGKATLLKGMLIFQMFPAVLSLVALYALFDRLGQYIPFIGLNTHYFVRLESGQELEVIQDPDVEEIIADGEPVRLTVKPHKINVFHAQLKNTLIKGENK